MSASPLAQLLDWRLRHLLRSRGIPDLPETRRLLRASWWHGFTFGAVPGKGEMREIRARAVKAVMQRSPLPRCQ